MAHVLVYTQVCLERVFCSMYKRTETDPNQITIYVRIQHTCKTDVEHNCLIFNSFYLLILNYYYYFYYYYHYYYFPYDLYLLTLIFIMIYT